MSRWKANLIGSNAASSTGTAYTGRADGVWTLNNQIQARKGSLWSRSKGRPDAPTITNVISSASQSVTITFNTPSDDGGYAITGYTATSSPGNLTSSGASSPITITGLTNDTPYTFTVYATNSQGNGAYSEASNSVTPSSLVDTIAIARDTYGATAVVFTAGTFTEVPNMATGTGTCSDITVNTTKKLCAVIDNALANKVHVYPFNSTTGFGTKYTSPTITATCSRVSFSPTGTDIVIGNNTSPFIKAYSFNNGWGAAYSNPASLPSQKVNPMFSPDGSTVFFTDSTSIAAYPWSAGGFGTKISAANGLASPDSTDYIDVHPSSNVVVIGSGSPTYVKAIPFSSNAWGTAYSSPATLPPGSCTNRRPKFSPTGTVVAFSSYIPAIYAWSSGFGTKYTNDTIAQNCSPRAVAFNSTGNKIVMVHSSDNGNSVTVWDWSNGFGTYYRNGSLYYQGQQVEFPLI